MFLIQFIKNILLFNSSKINYYKRSNKPVTSKDASVGLSIFYYRTFMDTNLDDFPSDDRLASTFFFPTVPFSRDMYDEPFSEELLYKSEGHV
jgi:hypothetical protein